MLIPTLLTRIAISLCSISAATRGIQSLDGREKSISSESTCTVGEWRLILWQQSFMEVLLISRRIILHKSVRTKHSDSDKSACYILESFPSKLFCKSTSNTTSTSGNNSPWLLRVAPPGVRERWQEVRTNHIFINGIQNI